MRIVVVGAGIAGLTLATALGARRGPSVVVLEQTHELSPIGAGLQLAPNAARPLLHLGLGPAVEEVAVRPRAREALHWEDGRLLHSAPMGAEFEKRYGAPFYTLLRSDLHRILLEAAPTATVRSGRYVTDVLESSDGVTLRCADGHETHADAAIGADGVHSTMRALLNTEVHRPAGQFIYRGLVPAERAPEYAEDPRIRAWLGTDRNFSCYPVSGGEAISFNASVPARGKQPESWTAEGRIEDLMRAFGGWHADVRSLISEARWIGVWGLLDRETVPAWNRGRIALMGDAAHPTLPFFAQGANQAVEDAVALAALLRTATAFTVDQALARYAAVRRERTDRVHALSRGVMHGLARVSSTDPDQRPTLLADAESLNADWVFGYDVVTDVGDPLGR